MPSVFISTRRPFSPLAWAIVMGLAFALALQRDGDDGVSVKSSLHCIAIYQAVLEVLACARALQ